MNRERLIKKYGAEIVAKACEYYEQRKQHFTIDKFIRKCNQLKRR